MLDAILLPIGEGNRILDQIAKGKIDELIAQTYQGDHEKMKQNVNGMALVLQKFQAEFAKLTEYSRQGQLGQARRRRRFPGRLRRDHQGRQRDARRHSAADRRGQPHPAQISGGNLTRRSILDCKGDHQKMKDAVNGVQTWLKELIAYVTAIANWRHDRQDGQGVRRRSDPRMADAC